MIVFKGRQLVVPATLRKEMMAATHNARGMSEFKPAYVAHVKACIGQG